MAELHCAVFMFSVAVERFGQPTADSSVLSILKKMTRLWGFHVLYTYSDQGFKEDYFTSAHIKNIEEIYFEMCKSLRTQVIGLTDGFGLPDFVLKAPIAKYDGDIYSSKEILFRPFFFSFSFFSNLFSFSLFRYIAYCP